MRGYQYSITNEMIIDNFAGGGGASTGIELATGRIVDIAVNHDRAAIEMHEKNHPYTRHYCEDVWEIDPRKVTQGRPVALVWCSPDCKHFSKAKGGAENWAADRFCEIIKRRYEQHLPTVITSGHSIRELATDGLLPREIVDKLVNKMVPLQLIERQRKAKQQEIEF